MNAKPHYELSITPEALTHIQETGKKHFQNAFVLVLADLHAIGGEVVPEVQPFDYMFDNKHFVELFDRGYQGFSFPIYVDQQMLREQFLPERMLIDYVETYEGKRLVFKNPDFES